MLPDILSITLIVVIVVSIPFVIQKRKQAGLTGIKSALTPICLYLMAIVNLFAYWFDLMGLLTWMLGFVLVILGAYFTKYMSASEA